MEPVVFRECACPRTPHPNGDTVTFKPKLTFDENVAALSAIFSGDGVGNANKAWGVYLHAGPVAWNLVDEEGKPLELNRENIDALPFEDQFEIGDRADDIYGAVVLAPLVRRTSSLSKNGSTSAGSHRPARRSPKALAP